MQPRRRYAVIVTPMKKFTLLSAALTAALMMPAGAFAAKAEMTKAKVVEKFDTNKNGKIDVEEYAAVRADFEAHPKGELARLDADHDGKLTDDEIAKLSGGGKKQKSDAEREEKRLKKKKEKV